MMDTNLDRILLVDDDQDLLDGLCLNHRKHYDLVPACGPLVEADWLRRAAESALTQRGGLPEKATDSLALSVVVADDETVRDLNRRHRGLDEVTDVLAFSFHHEGEYYGEGRADLQVDDFVLPPEGASGLGEVVISYPQASRQAESSGHSQERELAALLIHGVLHLLGHDHTDRSDEAVMRERERSALAQVLSSE